MPEENRGGESVGTVLVAGAANLAIAVAKLVAGALTGSSAMLAEGAHSVADTVNQVFLLTALKRSEKPADSRHPFGYGKERYFWSLLAAVGIFVLGAGFSVLEGIHALLSPEPVENLLVGYVVLGLAFVFEGASWLKALLQLRREAENRRVGLFRHVVTTPDPTAKTVAFEDTAALIGILLAAAGLTLHAVTGGGVWDGLASILIGLLLVVVAISLGTQSKRNLIGEAMPESARRGLTEILDETPGVDTVVELLTMRLGPEDVLVAARVDVEDDASGGDLERVADEGERRIRERYPEVRHVFLDPTTAQANLPTRH
ncbi:MAG: cation transporter [Nocardioidaceae bacterium]|nr:cation transporter [Nocardioidaceae bacterium]NUS50885.1 cation transporter [Nocardioidaceae bacterium]